MAEITNQMEYDDDVAHHAKQWLYDAARGGGRPAPGALTVSFTHPHDPYVARRRFWDLYEDSPHLEPEIGPIPYEDHDPPFAAHPGRQRPWELRRRDAGRAPSTGSNTPLWQGQYSSVVSRRHSTSQARWVHTTE